MDFGTALAIYGGKDLLIKLLGPTFDYIGGTIKDNTERMCINLGHIFSVAEKKLGEKINDEGKVPPKVLKDIVNNGCWCEDELQAEYFGGILASSRSEISRDDRGSYYSRIVDSLTTYQIRLHYLIYTELRELFIGADHNIGDPSVRTQLEIFIPFRTYIDAMDFSENEAHQFGSILQNSIWGLVNAGLVDNTFNFGPVEYVRKYYPKASDGGILLRPTTLGAELFLWAYGYGKSPMDVFFNPDAKLDRINGIKISEGTVATRKK